MTEAVIVGAARTPIGSFNGALAALPAAQLGARAIEEALRRARVQADEVDEVVMGNVLSAGLGQNPARQAAMAAGMPDQVPSTTINKVCGSGLKAVALAAQAIKLDEAETVVAGGMENMSASPYLLPRARSGYRLGHGKVVDSMIQDGLWCAFADCHMGDTAENVARAYGIERSDQDSFAVESQRRAAHAWSSGIYEEEVVSVEVPARKGNSRLTVSMDEHFRPDADVERLSSLKPVFQAEGTVTAGNSSGINDGAAAVVVMSKRQAQARGLDVMATIRACAAVGVQPDLMGIGPVSAVGKVLARCGLTLEQIDLIEANEAFAAQSLAVGRELGWDWERVNVNGGAIALGHPIGASGCRILVTLMYEMRRRQVALGLATLCIGGGQGIAMVVER